MSQELLERLGTAGFPGVVHYGEGWSEPSYDDLLERLGRRFAELALYAKDGKWYFYIHSAEIEGNEHIWSDRVVADTSKEALAEGWLLAEEYDRQDA